MSKIRFIDQVKVGAYKGSGGISIIDNQEHFLITATGDPDTLQANSQLIFKDNNLGIGESNPQARLEILETGNKDLLLIKNVEEKGIEVNNEGVLKLTEFTELPTVVEGGITYSQNNFWFGIKNN
jgi:hypothetical protein